ncbi:hypothetical protein CPC08DRAFT_623471 [Agrocybe pediades]|nr:hypothetical protein CPC08DRAFT_623471 [Agrocybe pediades]
MVKRSLSSENIDRNDHPAKRPHVLKAFKPIKVATAEAGAAADADTPLSQLTKLLNQNVKNLKTGASVIYWMRMHDLRLRDNKALSQASAQARKDNVPLLALFVISPQDYVAHDRSPRRIDFVLRNLVSLKQSLADLHIPLTVMTHTPRKTIPNRVLSFCEDYGARTLYANLEYEVDELRRDIQAYKLALSKDIQVTFLHDKCIVQPGLLVTKQDKAYAVYSPYQRNWITTVNANIPFYLQDCPYPQPNDDSIRSSKILGPLFDSVVPAFVEGFQLQQDDQASMKLIWPEGEEAAGRVLERFLTTKRRTSQLGGADPLSNGAEACNKHNRAAKYGNDRDRLDSDTTSRISAYLTSGVLSVRECARATILLSTTGKVETDKASGLGRWMQEVAWRDFYVNILAAFPRVSMGRPYIEKFSRVVWEDHQAPGDSTLDVRKDDGNDGEILKRWKSGMTGVPIVDAAMRCMNQMGWMHNRARMIAAMYLTKDLMIDWRVGERYFMEKLIDGDLSSNNGGWQWCASTGVDPCPYFRIFNPYTQSLKCDPTGDFIRHWVPELKAIRGPDLHNPSARLADKLGYPRPIIPHNEARDRALRRYKNPGQA